MARLTSTLLPQVSFSILLALSLKPRHGYEIMKQIAHDSEQRVQLGSGAIYGCLKKLSQANFIEEMPFEQKGRTYYRLTQKGFNRLFDELGYYKHIVNVAETRHLHPRS